jgi:hypothetical protein
MSAQKLQSWLSSGAALSSLAHQAAALGELQRLWETLAPPPLGRACRVAGIKDRVLSLYASNGAMAAKVRQLAPSLLEKLQKKGFEVTSIQVRVQVDVMTEPARPAKSLVLGAVACESLRDLADHLEDSPLRDAVEKMLKNCQ